MKIVTVVGARPQFIKAAPVSRALASVPLPVEEVLVHTGQHYDANMSEIFFRQLGIAEPRYNLGVGGGGHGEQTGRMLMQLEPVLVAERPNAVLVYGDTNSTLSGALAAAKLNIDLVHVEAGLRSFNRRMPEEINRVVTDHLSDLLLVPTTTAEANLQREGIVEGVHLVGDVMQDAVAEQAEVAARDSKILADLRLEAGKYFFVTVHRAENTDEPQRLASILQALEVLSRESEVVWPVHPRTRTRVKEVPGVKLIDPVSYIDGLMLQRNAQVVLTDSGGIQKEARWLGVPCVTLRDETEWVETLEGGWNRLAGTGKDSILACVGQALQRRSEKWDGISGSGASKQIAEIIVERYGNKA